MRHISYKDLSSDRYLIWLAAKTKMLRRSLRREGISEKQKEMILQRIVELSNNPTIQKQLR